MRGIIFAIAVLRHSRRRASKGFARGVGIVVQAEHRRAGAGHDGLSAPPSSIALFIPAISLCRRSGTSSNTLYILRAIFGRSPSLRSSMIPCVSGWQRSLTASSRLNSSGVDTGKIGLADDDLAVGHRRQDGKYLAAPEAS